MVTFAELFVAAMDGIGTFLDTTLTTSTGITADGAVTVRTGPITPEEYPGDLVVFGDLTALQSQAGLATRQATPSWPGWVIVTRSGGDEAATRTVRARAAAVMAALEAAVKQDPSAAGTVTNPGRIVVATSGVEQSPVDINGMAARRATIPFTLSWTAHITG